MDLEKERISIFKFYDLQGRGGGVVGLDQNCKISEILKKNEFYLEWIEI